MLDVLPDSLENAATLNGLEELVSLVSACWCVPLPGTVADSREAANGAEKTASGSPSTTTLPPRSRCSEVLSLLNRLGRHVESSVSPHHAMLRSYFGEYSNPLRSRVVEQRQGKLPLLVSSGFDSLIGPPLPQDTLLLPGNIGGAGTERAGRGGDGHSTGLGAAGQAGGGGGGVRVHWKSENASLDGSTGTISSSSSAASSKHCLLYTSPSPRDS